MSPGRTLVPAESIAGRRGDPGRRFHAASSPKAVFWALRDSAESGTP